MIPGRWRIGFALEFTGDPAEGAKARLTIEVVTAEGRRLASRDLRLTDLRDPAARQLDFEVVEQGVVHEFRVFIAGQPRGIALRFTGVDLEAME